MLSLARLWDGICSGAAPVYYACSRSTGSSTDGLEATPLLSPGRPLLLTHHSDRGLQYCCPSGYCHAYTGLLKKNDIAISMTHDTYENCLAERVNGILKDELVQGNYASFIHAFEHVSQVIGMTLGTVVQTLKYQGIYNNSIIIFLVIKAGIEEALITGKKLPVIFRFDQVRAICTRGEFVYP